MRAHHLHFSLACAPLVLFFLAMAPTEEPLVAEPPNLPTVKFFFFDSGGVEWAVSAEPERLQTHFSSNSDSQGLFQAVSAAVAETPDVKVSARQMTRWIESERQRFEQSRREPERMRMAEGILAYLRDHDFSIPKLVDSLKRRSGCKDVELVVVHLRDAQDRSTFKLKVVLVDPDIEVGKQGFNVNLQNAQAGYTVVTYALGLAMYEVHEILNRDTSEDGPQPVETIEPLPTPEPREQPTPPAVPASLRR